MVKLAAILSCIACTTLASALPSESEGTSHNLDSEQQSLHILEPELRAQGCYGKQIDNYADAQKAIEGLAELCSPYGLGMKGKTTFYHGSAFAFANAWGGAQYAQSVYEREVYDGFKKLSALCGNYTGYIQYRGGGYGLDFGIANRDDLISGC